MTNRRAAVSFTGGKDCSLCLHRVLKDESITVVLLVTFAPINSKPFLAHPIHMIEAQSKSIGIPHKILFVESPFLNSYQHRIKQLATDHGIELLFTGDILDVCDNFMVRATENTGVELIRPLWQIPRDVLKQELENEQFNIVISCTNIEKMGLVRANDSVGKSYFYVYEKLKQMKTIDAAGEVGEFHTMVVDAPFFTRRIQFQGTIRTDETGHYLYFDFERLQFIDKQS